MKKKIFTIVIFTFVFFIISCDKNSDENNSDTGVIYGNSLSEEDNAFLESISAEIPVENQGNGKDVKNSSKNSGTEDLASKLIVEMINDVQELSEQKKFKNHPSEGIKAPQHMGFVYRFGSRDLTARGFAKGGNKIHNSYSVFGTDCSGLMIILLKGAGIDISNTSARGFEESLKTALKTNSTYKKLKLENIGYIPFDKIKTGDFIIWLADPNREHIGIVKDFGAKGKFIFQSNGTSVPENEEAQKKNYSAGRGVHPIKLTETVQSYYWGTEYKILRLIDPDADLPLVGQDGDPRFNLQFTNPENVDLDLYVKTPSGAIIYFENPTADLGNLDVDCVCDDCPKGPNENIFWKVGDAKPGTYEYWVEYYDNCGISGSSSNFTLRVIRNGVILETKTGVLNSIGQKSATWTFKH